MPRTNPPKLADFEATLVFLQYSALDGGRAAFYTDHNTGHTYRLANNAIEKMIKLDQLRPVIVGRWRWTRQGNRPVIKPLAVTYAGLTFPDDAPETEG